MFLGIKSRPRRVVRQAQYPAFFIPLLWFSVCGAAGDEAPTPPIGAEHQPSVADLKRLQRISIFRVADDKQMSLGELGLGKRPILITMWATWCAPCIKEMPRLALLHQEFGRAVTFVGIAQDLRSAENRRAVKKIADEARLAYPQFVEQDGDTVEEQILGKKTSGLPAFVLFAADGSLQLGEIGSIDSEQNRVRLTGSLRRVSTPVGPGPNEGKSGDRQ